MSPVIDITIDFLPGKFLQRIFHFFHDFGVSSVEATKIQSLKPLLIMLRDYLDIYHIYFSTGAVYRA